MKGKELRNDELWLCDQIEETLVYVTPKKEFFVGKERKTKSHFFSLRPHLMTPADARALKMTKEKMKKYYQSTWGDWFEKDKINFN